MSPNKRMQPTSLGVTGSARGLASLAAHPAPPLTLAADTHPVRALDEILGLLQQVVLCQFQIALGAERSEGREDFSDLTTGS